MTPRGVIYLLAFVNLFFTVFTPFPTSALWVWVKGILWGVMFGIMLSPLLDGLICEKEERS